MKIGLAVFIFTLTAWLLPSVTVHGVQSIESISIDSNAPLCLPTLDLQPTGNCLHLGPIHYLSSMAELGITFPPLPLPATKPDPQLAVVPYRYARVINANAPVFASLDDAVRGQPALYQIEAGFDFVTYIDQAELNGKRFYYLEDVPWTMYFDKARALHGTFWHNRFGWPQSRGCVNLSPGDANWLFQWAKAGDWVYVWDPTGQTPTDPSFYGAGGA